MRGLVDMDIAAAVHRRYVGDKVPLKILRKCEEMELECELNKPLTLIPRGQYDVRPPFMLVGGILFQPLSLEFLQVGVTLVPAGGPRNPSVVGGSTEASPWLTLATTHGLRRGV